MRRPTGSGRERGRKGGKGREGRRRLEREGGG